MAANGDPANHSSASNKSTKKMKKRKELDALLTGSNGKSKHFNKPNKPPKKDGHELLIPDESDSLDSSENDFFANPKKTIIRKPRPWRICATCIPLCIFVLTLACIVVTTGLIWMHMDLKQDLDDLRSRLAKVESDVQTSQTQAATVITLENKLERLQGQTNANQQALTQMKTLNQSINDLKTQVKAIRSSQSNTAASTELQLQQDLAKMEARVNGLEEMKGSVKQLQDKMSEVTGNIGSLQTDVHQLQSPPGTSPEPHLEKTRPVVTHENYPEGASLLFIRKKLDGFGVSMDDMNSTLTTIRQYQQGLDARLTLLEAMGSAGVEPDKDDTVSITPQMMTVFTKIHNDVNTLMNWYNETQLHTPTEVSISTVDTPVDHLPDDVPDGNDVFSLEGHTQWEYYVNNTLMELQSKLAAVPTVSTNTDKPSVNISALIKQSLDNFTEVYRQDLHTTRDDIKTLMNNFNNVQDRFVLVYQRIDELKQNSNNAKPTTPPTERPISTKTPKRPFSTSKATPKQVTTNTPSAFDELITTPFSSELSTTPPSSEQPIAIMQENTPDMWQTTEQSLNDEVTTDVWDQQTTDDTMEGPHWQKPLDIFHPTKPPTVTFPSVTNVKDLETKFALWDGNGDGYVLYRDLPDFMGPFTPPEAALMKFDADKNGVFDLSEMIAAAGLE